MLQLRCELNLTPEPLDVHGGGQLREKDLDHDLAAERTFVGHEYPRHPAPAELAFQLVGVAEGELQLLLEAGAHGVEVGRSRKCRERD
jgi:hypothetical protein